MKATAVLKLQPPNRLFFLELVIMIVQEDIAVEAERDRLRNAVENLMDELRAVKNPSLIIKGIRRCPLWLDMDELGEVEHRFIYLCALWLEIKHNLKEGA